ncbi:PEP-CTERM sorting domain-containing protein [Adhaeretor mobilis]|uniref:PEP-CTERM protein-sorting domain-containing protein n=1 Tax=Adhaeretor mobilis TaxID=1930276 RepID=A0A517MPU6_9BACT|nr:PEP-CTERM sorting domain-containing protein [Adhaeretor mobilis]QDS96908.1 hypothetical protein HG15A2_01670 [Adhaeretor mobilis]
MRTHLRDICFGFAIIGMLAGTSQAATLRMSTSGNWNVAANWDGGAVPTNGTSDLANVGSSSGGGISPATAEVTDAQDASRIILGESTSTTGTINVQSGGSLTDFNRTQIAAGPTSTGTLNVYSGGTFTHSGTGGFVVGNGAGSNGTLSVDGGTVISTTQGVSIGSSSGGANATGLVEVKNGGTLNVTVNQQSLLYDDWTLSVSGSSADVDFAGQLRALNSGTYKVGVDGDLNVDLANSLRLDAHTMTIEPMALGALASGDYTVMRYSSLASGTDASDMALNDVDPSGTWTIQSVGSNALVLNYAAATIPEPTSLVMLTLAAGLGLTVRKRR